MGVLIRRSGSRGISPWNVKRVARMKNAGLLTAAVFDHAFERLGEFGARMLEYRKSFSLVLRRGQEGFEELVRNLAAGKQVIGVTAVGAFADHPRAGALFDELCTALRHVEIAEQCGERSVWATRSSNSRPAEVCAFSIFERMSRLTPTCAPTWAIVRSWRWRSSRMLMPR
jgi:hypothetical protein